MLEQNKCDIRDQHGLEHIFHCVTSRIVDFIIFTPRTMHPIVALKHMGNSTLVIPPRPFLKNAANAPTDKNDTLSDLSYRREYL